MKSERISKKKFATWLSAALWILGFALAFVIKPATQFIWVPDCFLLCGFFPLLYLWKPGWPFLIFGICNAFIGFVLQVAQFLPDSSLPSHMSPIRAHLALYHVPMVWIWVGIASIIFGLVRMIKHLIAWLNKRRK